METRKELIEMLLRNKAGVIEVRSYTGHSGHKRLFAPVWDDGLMWYKGVKHIDDNMRKGTEPFVDPDDRNNSLSRITLSQGDRFDLANPIDRLKLTWLLECEYGLALSYEEGKDNTQQTFYVYNEEVETQKRVDKMQYRNQALTLLNAIPSENLVNIARLLGFKMRNKSPEEIRIFLDDSLISKANSLEFAKKFIQVVNDKANPLKLFAYKAIDRGIIKLNSKGEYRHENEYIGMSFDSVISWLRGPENQASLQAIQDQLNDKITVLFTEDTKTDKVDHTEEKEEEETSKGKTSTKRRTTKSTM